MKDIEDKINMSLESVRKQFEKAGIADRIMEFDQPSATVEEAARDLGCQPEEICKTMAFDVDGKTVLIAMAGDVKVSNHKYKVFFHKKAKMLRGDEVVQRTSHPIGGVCPFGLMEGCVVYLDASLKRFERVYPACGSINSAIGVTLEELVSLSHAESWVDVSEPLA